MGGTPPVCVLMCVRNGGRFLAAAVDSVLKQSYPHFRFLIVDDASTDGSGGIILGFRDPRIDLVRNESNLGLTKSLNRGLALAQGGYLARMDADDLCHPDRLKRQVEYMESHPEVVACGAWARLIDGSDKDIGRMKTPAGGSMAYRYWRPPVIIHPTALLRLDAVRRLGYDESIVYGQDYDLWLRLHKVGILANLPEYLLRYRLHGEAITAGKREQQLESSYRIFKKHFRGEGVSYAEYASFLFAYTATPWARWGGMRKLAREVPMPLWFRAVDNAKYALKWLKRK